MNRLLQKGDVLIISPHEDKVKKDVIATELLDNQCIGCSEESSFHTLPCGTLVKVSS